MDTKDFEAGHRVGCSGTWGITTDAETLLVDLAVLHYALALRVQGWIGDLAVRIEHEFFDDDAFTEVVKGQRRVVRLPSPHRRNHWQCDGGWNARASSQAG
jgi:hypothetical protein